MTDAPEINADTALNAALFEGDAGKVFGETPPGTFGELFTLASKGAQEPVPQEFGMDTAITLEMVPEKMRPTFEAKKLETLGAFMDSYGALEAKVGTDTVKAPVKGETVEFLANNKEALGVPEEAGGYEYEPPQMPDGVKWDEAGEKAVRDWAHGNNLPPDLFKSAMDLAVEQRLGTMKAFNADVSENDEKFQAQLQKDWGGDKDRNVEIAQNAVAELGLAKMTVKGEGNIEIPLLDKLDSELGAVGVMTLFKMLGDKMKSSELITGDGTTLSKTQQQAQQELSALKGDKDFMARLNNRQDPGHAEALKKWEAAQQAAVG